MAEVTENLLLRQRIDHYLSYLLREWEGIPHLAAEWADWDELSRLTFDVNWTVPEDRLHQLRQWAKEGRLTPEQTDRYEELLKLVEQHRPTLERLLDS